MKQTSLPPRLLLGAAALLALLILLTGGPALAEGQSAPLGKVTVQNNYLLTPSQITSALGLTEGAAFDADALKAAVQKWNADSGMGTLAYRIEPVAGGRVDLFLDVSERVALTGVYFQGNVRLSSKRLTELLSLAAGQTVTSFQVHAMEQQIMDAYKQAGYPLASDRAVLGSRGTGPRDITFYVAEGPRLYVAGVAFSGNTHIPAGELRAAMASKVRHWPAFIWPGWFDEQTFNQDIALVEGACRATGYLDAEAAGYVSYSEDMTNVTLRVIVHEGPRYFIKALVFEGNTIFRDSELAAHLPLAVGAPLRPADLETAASQIASMYKAQGYMDVDPAKETVRAAPVFPATGTDVTVRIVIHEGQPVFIRRIEIVGLTKTKESVVRRNLDFYPGERASSEKIKESEQLLTNTGYFDPQARPPVQITLEPDQGAMRDAIVHVQEGATGKFMAGVGLGSDSGLLGQISVSEDNFDIANWPSGWDDLIRGNAFRGAGQKLNILLEPGTENSYYSISWLNPAVHDSDYSFGVNLYSADTTHREFDERRTGMSLVGGEALTKFIQRTITVGYELISLSQLPKNPAAEIEQDKDGGTKPFVRFEVSTDRRDDARMPTSGYTAKGSIELSAGAAEDAKLDLSATKYWTIIDINGLHKQVLSLSGHLGVVTSYGDHVPVYERYYAGGFSTLRGFEFEGVSPVDPATGQAIGGNGLLTGSAEYSIPVTRDDSLRLLGFVDAGYVTLNAANVLTAWGDMRVAPGVGIRWQVPFLGNATIEVDLAVPVLKQPGDKTSILSFNFGGALPF